MTEIALFRLPNNHNQTLNIIARNRNGSIFVSVQKGSSLIASFETDKWEELLGFLRLNQFQRYEARSINPMYFDWMERLKKEISGKKPTKINSQRRILILLKRLQNKESLDLKMLADEFNLSHSQLVRDIATIRRVFEKPEIQYNRTDNTYNLKR